MQGRRQIPTERAGGTGRRFLPAGLLATAAVLAGLAGCTSDDPSAVGVTAPGELDLNPVQVTVVRDVAAYGHVAVKDPERPYDQNHVLYVGEDDHFASEILVRYDLALPDSFPADVTLDAVTVDSVYLRFFRLHAYDAVQAVVDTVTGDTLSRPRPLPEKVYEVFELADTLDTSRYPGPPPPVARQLAVTDRVGDLVKIPLSVSVFLDWLDAGAMTGLDIREGSGSDPGLVGYASSELTEYDQIQLEHEDTRVGVVLVVILDPALDLPEDLQRLVFVPTADVSTMHRLEAAPTSPLDGMVVRTHLRDYPWFAFDLSSLPPGSYVNRAELLLAPDTTANAGPLTTLVLSEAPRSLVETDTLSLDDLVEVTAVAGLTSVDPRSAGAGAPWFGFTVTGSVQRFANDVFSEPTVWLLTGAEDAFRAYDTSILDPDFYLARIGFHGTAAGAVAPKLRITYTVFSGGGT